MSHFISIIVPNYNHASFLEKRLESIFDQTYQNFEVIFLDDASTDGSQEILDKYSTHPKVSHYIRNKQNSGSPFLQWQKGIQLAKGDFIWIAESDDYCEDHYLQSILEKIEDHHILAYCASQNIDNNGDVLGLNTWASGLDPDRWSRNYENEGKKEIKHFLRYRNCIPNASAVLFRKSAVKTSQIPVFMKFCGDWLLWIEILSKGDVLYLSQAMNYFRRHTSSSREIKSLALEKKRFREYVYIIKNNSNFFSRCRNYEKYEWIFVEIERKKKFFKNFFLYKLDMPLELLIRYLFRK